ncbi:MAG: hypothetical protein ABJE47_05255 [bacterium]
MNRALGSLSFLLLAAAPLAAQQAMKDHDPDKKIAGGGLPAGWMGRTDGADSKITDVKFVPMGDGYHVTSGPAAIYWTDKTKVSGAFAMTVTLKQTKAPAHPEAYGVFFTGDKLTTPEQTYYYLLVRGDGSFALNHRAAAEVHHVIPWTPNEAVHKADASGVSSNTLMVDATKPDSIRLKVNGVQVAALAGGKTYSFDGVAGVRVNHNLDVDVSAIKITH